MAKNVPEKQNAVIRIKRHLNEPHMPYISENKLDHAMYELRNAKQETLNFRNRLYVSIGLNLVLAIVILILK
jgi:hypothetical protein